MNSTTQAILSPKTKSALIPCRDESVLLPRYHPACPPPCEANLSTHSQLTMGGPINGGLPEPPNRPVNPAVQRSAQGRTSPATCLEHGSQSTALPPCQRLLATSPRHRHYLRRLSIHIIAQWNDLSSSAIRVITEDASLSPLPRWQQVHAGSQSPSDHEGCVTGTQCRDESHVDSTGAIWERLGRTEPTSEENQHGDCPV